MSLKTEYSYNEDDFVQNGNGMQELTVTITLCEYRNLLKDITYQDHTIEKLEEENASLKKQNKVYQEHFIANCPEIIEKMGELANLIIKGSTDEELTEGGNEDGMD